MVPSQTDPVNSVTSVSGTLAAGQVGTSASTPTAFAGLHLPDIEVDADLGRMCDENDAALVASGRLYQRAGRIVRPVVIRGAPTGQAMQRTAGSPIIDAVDHWALLECMATSAEWWQQGKKGTQVAVLPPTVVAHAYIARREWALPVLADIIETPTLRADGSILSTPGYDPATGLLLMPCAPIAPVPSSPTRDDARSALRYIDNLLIDFPFAEPGDRSGWTAMVMSIIARGAIAGPVPLTAIGGPTPGLGKSLLADLASVIARGRHAGRMAPIRETAEMRRQCLGIGMAGDSFVLIDNVDGAFGSEVLAGAITAGEIVDRPTGKSEMVRAPFRAVWAITGNNLSFVGDLGRRVILADLYTELEHPEDRTDFQHANVLDYALGLRGRIVAAALTVLRAFHLAGRPPHGGPQMGSFERWDALVRSSLIWAGAADPRGTVGRIREAADADVQPLRDALLAWRKAFGHQARTVVEAMKQASSDPDLAAALSALVGCDSKSFANQLGRKLRRMAGRNVGGLRFQRENKGGSGVRWCVVEVLGATRTDG